MSTAPRPHTSPSIELAAERIARASASSLTGTTSVWPSSSSVGASGSEPSMRATRLARPGCGSYDLDVEPGAARGGCASTSTLRASPPDVDVAVVDARVADELLQEVGDLRGGVVGGVPWRGNVSRVRTASAQFDVLAA